MALTAATITATAGSASASDLPGIDWDHVYSATGVKVYVEEHGDIISVCDAKANGHAAWVQVDDFSTVYTSTATNGNGSCVTRQASDGPPFDLKEGNTVALIFNGDGSTNSADYASASFLNDH